MKRARSGVCGHEPFRIRGIRHQHLLLAALQVVLVLLAGGALAAPQVPAASYRVELAGGAAPRIRVQATLPGDDTLLAMATSRSADVPDIADAGWPGLIENLIGFVNGSPDIVVADGFNLKIIAFDQWQEGLGEIRRVMSATLGRVVPMFGFEGRGDCVVVLLPHHEGGGESFRSSFTLTTTEAPSRANAGRWGNLITHEVIHYWNGWRLRGADYASSQWFQEGVTEHLANLAMVSAGIIESDEFYGKLAVHVANYRRLSTSLAAPGTHQGPPLYSGGALVAFIWDATIRESTGGAHGLGEVLRALLREAAAGTWTYTWADVQAALEAVAPADWAGFHDRHIKGTEPLPLADALSRLGLVGSLETDDAIRVGVDPDASVSTQALRAALLGGNPQGMGAAAGQRARWGPRAAAWPGDQPRSGSPVRVRRLLTPPQAAPIFAR